MYGVIKTLRQPGIETRAQRWQRWILPLNHWHILSLTSYKINTAITQIPLPTNTPTSPTAHLPSSYCPHKSINTLHTHHITYILVHPHIKPHTYTPTIQKYIYKISHIATYTHITFPSLYSSTATHTFVMIPIFILCKYIYKLNI